MAPKGRGAVWESIVREAGEQLDPRWTIVGRGSKTVPTWGRIGWVWESIGLDLKSGDVHTLYTSRTWLDEPFGRVITDMSDRSFTLDGEGAVGELRRWAALVPASAFTNTLELDLEELEWHLDLFQSENARLPWTPLAGLRLVFGRDPLPVLDQIDAFLRPLGDADPHVVFFREFRSQLVEHGREATLLWLDDRRRAALRAERVPDDLVAPVV